MLVELVLLGTRTSMMLSAGFAQPELYGVRALLRWRRRYHYGRRLSYR